MKDWTKNKELQPKWTAKKTLAQTPALIQLFIW